MQIFFVIQFIKKRERIDKISHNIQSDFENSIQKKKSVFLDLINFFDEKDKSILRDHIENISFDADFSKLPLDVLLENNVLKQY